MSNGRICGSAVREPARSVSQDQKAPADLLLRQPAYRSLRAIRLHRVYAVPELTFLNEPAEDPLLLQWLDESLRPGEAPCETREAYRDTFRYIYGYSLSDDQIDRALWLTRNRHSSGYSRFARSRTSASPECPAPGSAAAADEASARPR